MVEKVEKFFENLIIIKIRDFLEMVLEIWIEVMLEKGNLKCNLSWR